MKKILKTTLLLFFICGLIFAAGGKDKGTADTGPITIQFWGAIPPENGPQELVDNFNKKFDNKIRAEYTRFVNDDAGNTKLETALIAGEVDVFINYPVTSLYKRIDAGLFAPLDNYIERDKIDLVKEFGEHNYVYNGKKYFIPTYGGPNAYIMYNMDIFAKAGIKVPEQWTWEDYIKIARQLTSGSGNSKVFGTTIGSTISNVEWAVLALNAYGGDYMYKKGTKKETNFDAPAFLTSMKMRHQMEIVDKSAIPYMDIKTTKMDIAAEYAKGNVAMIWANYHLRDIKNITKYPHTFKTSFVAAPAFEINQGKIYSGGLREWIGISTRSQKKDAAWEFLKYYATEGYYPMCNSNRIPAWKGADSAKVAALILGPDRDKIFDVNAFEFIHFKNPRHVDLNTTRTEGAAQLAQIMGEEFESVLLGQKSPEDAIVSLKKRGDSTLNDIIK